MKTLVWFSALLLTMISLPQQAKAEPACTQTFKVVRSSTVLDPDDILQDKILAEVGCQKQVIHVEGDVGIARRFELLKAGEIDLISGVSKRPEREVFAHFSLAIRHENFRAWIRPNDSDQLVGRNLKQLIADGWKVIGPQQGYFGPYYDSIRHDPKHMSAEYLVFSRGVQSLLKNRGDILLGGESWPTRLPASLASSITLLPDIVHSEPLHLAFSRASVSPVMVARFDRAIESLALLQKP